MPSHSNGSLLLFDGEHPIIWVPPFLDSEMHILADSDVL